MKNLFLFAWPLVLACAAVIYCHQTRPDPTPLPPAQPLLQRTAQHASHAASQPASNVKKLRFLDGTYLWGDGKINPPGLGMGLQPCPLLAYSSGVIRDEQGIITSNRLMIEPNLNTEVVAEALKPFPKGGWVVLDAEGAHSYDVRESFPHEQNVKGFARWQAYIKAVKNIRPDLKVAAIICWHSPDGGNYHAKVNWTETQACQNIFIRDINPLLDALAIEFYYCNFTAPPAPTPGDETFAFYGSAGLRLGFRDHIAHLHEYARALTGKPPVHVFSIGATGQPEAKFLTGPQMAQCLDLLAMYDPAAIMLWGCAAYENPHRLQGGFEIGTWDPNADWVKEVRKRIDRPD